MVVAVGAVREAKEPGHQGVKQIPQGTHPSQGNQLSGVQPVTQELVLLLVLNPLFPSSHTHTHAHRVFAKSKRPWIQQNRQKLNIAFQAS